jgi:predicted metal-dependent hydrolase
MHTRIQLGDIPVEIVRRDIKNVHLSVHPPTGRVRVAAPLRMSLNTVRVYAISKLAWIKRQQTKLREQERETRREFIDRESHYFGGRRYLLKVIEVEKGPSVELAQGRMLLRVRPGTGTGRREEVVEQWLRAQLRDSVPPLIDKWERLMGVKVKQFFIQRMKTKWGSCNHRAASIRLNTDLARKPRECLEYIIVHEMAHLVEPTHNDHFATLMDHAMPKWKFYRDLLNQLPLRHENWDYGTRGPRKLAQTVARDKAQGR